MRWGRQGDEGVELATDLLRSWLHFQWRRCMRKPCSGKKRERERERHRERERKKERERINI